MIKEVFTFGLSMTKDQRTFFCKATNNQLIQLYRSTPTSQQPWKQIQMTRQDINKRHICGVVVVLGVCGSIIVWCVTEEAWITVACPQQRRVAMDPFSQLIFTISVTSFLIFQWLFHKGSPWVSERISPGFLSLSAKQKVEWNSRWLQRALWPQRLGWSNQTSPMKVSCPNPDPANVPFRTGLVAPASSWLHVKRMCGAV